MWFMLHENICENRFVYWFYNSMDTHLSDHFYELGFSLLRLQKWTGISWLLYRVANVLYVTSTWTVLRLCLKETYLLEFLCPRPNPFCITLIWISWAGVCSFYFLVWLSVMKTYFAILIWKVKGCWQVIRHPNPVILRFVNLFLV